MTLDTRQAEALSDGELWETINRTQDQLESGDYAGAGRSVATITDRFVSVGASYREATLGS
ncbi:MAG: hypothetical protein AB8H86_28500 [Polyangiales bacterium]